MPDKNFGMEPLFSTQLFVDNQNITYQVYFSEEQYNFVADSETASIPVFSVRREHDEWISEEGLSSDLKKQSEEALEGYLLQQH